jgi:uncharacterized protein YjbJ (UPF0337 family)
VDKDRIEGKTEELEGEAQQGWGEAKDTGSELGEEIREALDRGADEDAIDLGER